MLVFLESLWFSPSAPAGLQAPWPRFLPILGYRSLTLVLASPGLGCLTLPAVIHLWLWLGLAGLGHYPSGLGTTPWPVQTFTMPIVSIPEPPVLLTPVQILVRSFDAALLLQSSSLHLPSSGPLLIY